MYMYVRSYSLRVQVGSYMGVLCLPYKHEDAPSIENSLNWVEKAYFLPPPGCRLLV